MEGSGIHVDEAHCTEWSSSRIFLEVVLVLALFENIIGCLVTFFARNDKFMKENVFNSLCLVIVNLSGFISSFTLLVFPLMMPPPTSQIYMPLFNDNATNIREECLSSRSPYCNWTGFAYSFFSSIPLAAILVMSLDRILSTLCWKAYKFNKMAISTMRLMLLFFVCVSFFGAYFVPLLDSNIHYHYEPFLKVCVLPLAAIGKEEKMYLITIHGFVLFLIFMMLGNGMVLVSINQFQQKSAKRKYSSTFKPNNEVSILFSRFIIFRTSAWRAFQDVCTAEISILFATYLIQSGLGLYYIVNKAHSSHELMHLFQISYNLLSLLIPVLVPLFQTFLYLPHRRRLRLMFKRLLCRYERCESPNPLLNDSDSDNSDLGLSWEGFSRSNFFPFSIKRIGSRKSNRVGPSRLTETSVRVAAAPSVRLMDPKITRGYNKYKPAKKHNSENPLQKIYFYPSTTGTDVTDLERSPYNQFDSQKHHNFTYKVQPKQDNPNKSQLPPGKRKVRKPAGMRKQSNASRKNFSMSSSSSSPDLSYGSPHRSKKPQRSIYNASNRPNAGDAQIKSLVYDPETGRHQVHIFHHHVWDNKQGESLQDLKRESENAFPSIPNSLLSFSPNKDVQYKKPSIPNANHAYSFPVPNSPIRMAATGYHDGSPHRSPRRRSRQHAFITRDYPMPIYSNRLELDVSEEPDDPYVRYEKIGGFKYASLPKKESE